MRRAMGLVKALLHKLGYEVVPTGPGDVRVSPEAESSASDIIQGPVVEEISHVVCEDLVAPSCTGPEPFPTDGVMNSPQKLNGSVFTETCRQNADRMEKLGITRAHYGSGPRLLGEGWVNLDLISSPPPEASHVYLCMDLASRHPFPSDFFEFGFAEDFIEHLDQPESLLFLSEVFRTLRPRGVLRLSFPGLRGVLHRHYASTAWEDRRLGIHQAFTHWEHKHFYCEESLSLVARHLGFSDVQFVGYGLSEYPELCDLDSRPDQKDLNIYVELTK